MLLALLALALPTAVLANSITTSVDYEFSGGTFNDNGHLGGNVVNVSSSMVNTIRVNGGGAMSASGPVQITMMLAGSSASSTSVVGGTITINAGGFDFSGTITGGAWTVGSTHHGGSFAFSIDADGTLKGVPTVMSLTTGGTTFAGSNPFGHGGTGRTPFESGDSFVSTASSTIPEPGTLSLLGTGFFGIVGLVRRRLRLYV